MKITIINVGYGDSLLYETDGGKRLLIDGGSNLESEFAGDEYRIRCADYLKEKNIHYVDALIISHIHEDHVCGLEPLLEWMDVGEIYTQYPLEIFEAAKEITIESEKIPRSVELYTKALNSYVRIVNLAKKKKIPVKKLSIDDEFTLIDEIRINVLGPAERMLDSYMDLLRGVYDSTRSEEQIISCLTKLDALSNHTSLLLYMQLSGIVMLEAADSIPSQWENVSFSLLENVNVLKLPHHGQIDSIDQEKMKVMPLAYVITTASSDRRYNSANKKVYETLSSLFSDREPPRFLFSDEREYAPYFKEKGFNAIIMFVDSGKITTEFIKI